MIMKKIYNKILLLLSLVLLGAGCTTVDVDVVDPTSNGSLNIIESEIEFHGTFREGVSVEGNYIEVPFYKSTGARLSIDAADLPYGISLDYEVQIPISSDTSSFKIYMYGSPEVYGQDVPFKFTLSNDDIKQAISTSTRIYGNGEELENLVFRSLGVSFSDVYRYTETQGELSITYYNACGRTVTLELISDYFSLDIDDNASTITLANSTEQSVMKVPIVGSVNKSSDGETSTELELVLSYRDESNYSQSSSRSSNVNILSNYFQVTSDEFVGVNTYDEELGDDAKLVLFYSYGEQRKVTFNVTSDTTGITVETNKTITLEQGEGSVEFKLEGTPSKGKLEVAFSISGDDYYHGADSYTSDDYYLVDNPTLSNLVFKAPFVEGCDDTQTPMVYVDYEGVEAGSSLKLNAISGLENYVGIDAENLSGVDAFYAKGASGTAFFDISELIGDGNVSENNTYPSPQNLTVEISNAYGSDNSTTISQNQTLKGFVWDGYMYNVIEINGCFWLDRNLRAKTNISGYVDVNASNLLTWSVVPGIYGAYYQRGRSTGLDMVNTDECVAEPFLSTGLSDDYWQDNIWSVAPSSLKATTPLTSTEEEYTSTLDALYNDTDGGENNPCPPGFRVPTTGELYAMVTSLDENFSTESVVTPYAMLNSEMKIAPSGVIHQNGPTGREVSYLTTTGERYMAGYYYNHASAATASSAAYVCLLSCSYMPHADIVNNNLYVSYLQVTHAGVVSTVLNGRVDLSMPIRAIKKY